MTTLQPMTNAQYCAYVAQSVPAYAADKVASAQWSLKESLALAQKAFAELLPQGLSTPDNYFFSIVSDTSESVGWLWIAAQELAEKRIAYVYDVGIEPEYRRRGHATRAFAALEQKVQEMKLSGIALHVFGHNTQAYTLYARLGFLTTDISMYKEIRP